MTAWPDSYDFYNDKTCQGIFKPFIMRQLEQLKNFDAKRPAGTAYIFHEHAERVAKDVEKTCLHIGFSDIVAYNMYWAVLPHDIGKQLLPVEIWDIEEKPGGDMKRLRRSHTELGLELTQQVLGALQHPFRGLMEDIMLNHHEQMDGKGYRSLLADQISAPVRLAAIVEAFDGWQIPRPHFADRDISTPGVLQRMRDEKLYMFDPALFEAFADMKMMEYNKSTRKESA